MKAVSGNTYPVKDQIKALGGRWNPDRKVWMVPDAVADEAQRLVAGAGPSRSYSSRGRGCGCDCGDCDPCRCESHCNCRGGNVYDC